MMRNKLFIFVLLIAAAALAACSSSGSAEPQVITETVTLEVTRVETVVETITETTVETVTVVETVTEQVQVMALPAVDPLAVTGDIITAGSSTVFPLTERMAERFRQEGYGGNITVDSIGSGAGLERFCVAGESDIANASRPIRDSEVESCRAIGREPIEFRVGTDALAIVVNPANDFVDSLTLEELALAFSTAATWADVREGWPATPIIRFSPGTDSGTFDYFVEEVFDEDEEPILSAANLQLSEDDNVLVQGVEGDANAIGYFGYAYYEENAGKLRIVPIEGVEATAGHVEDGTYPLARPLFIYSDAGIMAAKPQVAAFINFYLTYVNDEVVDVGYFPSSTAALNQAKQNWVAGIAGSASAGAGSQTGVILPDVDPLAVTGDIITAGSSTVFPLTERMAERFRQEGYGGNITVDSIGSGAGLERFCVAGESDIANASRPIRDSEVESCRAIGREPIEFRVGTDALAIVVNPANDFVDSLTLEELALAFSTAATWADVREGWPATPIIRFSPGTDSGTFDYFVEEVFDEDEEPILSAANLQLSEDDNVLVQGVEGDANAIGYFGYAYYEENAGKLRIVPIEGVEATAGHVEDGTYPLARPLFIYSDAGIMAAKPQVAAFINFYLTYVNDEVVDVGYFPASDDALNLAKFNWLNANN
ncbi:MAG TPA: PstS family phosphate ABC transporter substrate-binding protein [Chloroflexota bacterium]|nr:PstS family phosphate ABC transporter substrate-binding protein [Chloroflexota bacterium]